MNKGSKKQPIVSPFFEKARDVKMTPKEKKQIFDNVVNQRKSPRVVFNPKFIVEIGKICGKFGFVQFSIEAVSKKGHKVYGEGTFYGK